MVFGDGGGDWPGLGSGWAVTGRGGEGCIKIKDRIRISWW